MSHAMHASAPGRGDLAFGLLLLGAFYGIEWALRRMPRTRLERMAERMAVGTRRAGHAAKAGSLALVRFEREALERN